MGMRDESEPIFGTLGDTLLALGLITQDELQMQKLLQSPEFKKFERSLKRKYPHKRHNVRGFQE